MVYLIDPLPQIRKWAPKIFHVHGKDATIRWDVIREHGIFGKEKFVFMRTPGFGDSNWTDIISELRLAGWSGSIDIEGWHDPVYRDALEMTGSGARSELPERLPRRRLRRRSGLRQHARRPARGRRPRKNPKEEESMGIRKYAMLGAFALASVSLAGLFGKRRGCNDQCLVAGPGHPAGTELDKRFQQAEHRY
jgi:hypothetical protein